MAPARMGGAKLLRLGRSRSAPRRLVRCAGVGTWRTGLDGLGCGAGSRRCVGRGGVPARDAAMVGAVPALCPAHGGGLRLVGNRGDHLGLFGAVSQRRGAIPVAGRRRISGAGALRHCGAADHPDSHAVVRPGPNGPGRPHHRRVGAGRRVELGAGLGGPQPCGLRPGPSHQAGLSGRGRRHRDPRVVAAITSCPERIPVAGDRVHRRRPGRAVGGRQWVRLSDGDRPVRVRSA